LLIESKRFLFFPVRLAFKIFGRFSNVILKFSIFDDLILRSGLRISPQGYFSIFLFQFFFIALPISLITFIFLHYFLNYHLLSFTIPALIIAFSVISFYLYPYIRISLRKNGVLSELPFISTYFSILGLSHVPIYKGFERLSVQNVFPWFKFESELFLIDYTFFSKDPLMSIKNLCIHHPCKEFKDYFESYVRAIESGGYPLSFLLDYTSNISEKLSNRLKRFLDDVNIFGDLIVTLFVFLPLGLIGIFIVMNPLNALLWLKLYGFIFSPLIALSLFLVIDSSQMKFPFKFSEYRRIFLFSIPLSIIVLAVCVKLNFEFPIIFTIFFTSLLTPASFVYEFNTMRNRALEFNIPKFVRDLSEYIKIGLSIEGAIALASKNSYGDALDKIIHSINSSLSFSTKSITDIFNELISKINSWFAKTIFWLFGEAISTGGGTADIFSFISKFCLDYYEFKRKIENELRIYIFIGYFASLILIFVSSQLITFLNFFKSGYGASNLNIDFMVIDNSTILNLMNVIHSTIILISFLTGILIGKISGGTIFSGFKHALISCYICLFGIYYGGVKIW